MEIMFLYKAAWILGIIGFFYGAAIGWEEEHKLYTAIMYGFGMMLCIALMPLLFLAATLCFALLFAI